VEVVIVLNVLLEPKYKNVQKLTQEQWNVKNIVLAVYIYMANLSMMDISVLLNGCASFTAEV
jgi:hypothetical protein